MDHLTEDFADFYVRARDDCLRAVYASVGHRQEAEDLVAEAFAKAWARWATVRRHPAPRAWVVRTALNAGISGWRRRQREVMVPDAMPTGSTDGYLDGAVDRQLMMKVLKLPDRQRQVVALRLFLDLDTDQTAHVLGIAAGTVTAHLARAIATLRQDLSTELKREEKI